MAYKKAAAAAAIAAMSRRRAKRMASSGAASEAAEEAADEFVKRRLAKPKRSIPKDITRRGPKKPSNPPKAPPKKGGRPVRPGPMVRVKKDKDGNWVRQPVPKPQGGPPGMYYPKTKKRKPAPK